MPPERGPLERNDQEVDRHGGGEDRKEGQPRPFHRARIRDRDAHSSGHELRRLVLSADRGWQGATGSISAAGLILGSGGSTREVRRLAFYATLAVAPFI